MAECLKHTKDNPKALLPFSVKKGKAELIPGVVFTLSGKPKQVLSVFVSAFFKVIMPFTEASTKLSRILNENHADEHDPMANVSSGFHFLHQDAIQTKLYNNKHDLNAVAQIDILVSHIKYYLQCSAFDDLQTAVGELYACIYNAIKSGSDAWNTLSSKGSMTPSWPTLKGPFIFGHFPLKGAPITNLTEGSKTLFDPRNTPAYVTLHEKIFGKVLVHNTFGEIIEERNIAGASCAFADLIISPNGEAYNRLVVGTFSGLIFIFIQDKVYSLYYGRPISGIRGHDSNNGLCDPTKNDARIAIWTNCSLALLDVRKDKIYECYYHQLSRLDYSTSTILNVTFCGNVLCALFDVRHVPTPGTPEEKNPRTSVKSFKMFDVIPSMQNPHHEFGPIFSCQGKLSSAINRQLNLERLGAFHELPKCLILGEGDAIIRSTYNYFSCPLIHMEYKKDSNGNPQCTLTIKSYDQNHTLIYKAV